MTTEREAFVDWDDTVQGGATRQPPIIVFQTGYQAGRAALLAEIRAGGFRAYQYRYEDGITNYVRSYDPIEVIKLYRLPDEGK